MQQVTHHQVLVIGGGNGGISLAARLKRYGVDDIGLVDPNTRHVYKPLFSHVAGGTARAHDAVRPQASVMPKGVTWIRDYVVAIDPATSSAELAGGGRVTYDQIVLSPGIQQDWDAVTGLREALDTSAVASHYTYEGAAKMSLLLRDLTRGTVVFTEPSGPGSCRSAAQKPMYQACDYWRASGVLGDIRVVMVVPGDTVFGLPHIDRELDRKIAEYGIELRTGSELIEIDSDAREVVVGGPDGTERIAYDVLNVEPPQSAPDWLARSGLAAATSEGGFVEVNPLTLQHERFANVWAIGDAAHTRNSKCGGALRQQTMAVAKNIVAVLRGEEPTSEYNQYGVVPFTVSRTTVVWAEFGDNGQPMPTIPFWKNMYREARLSWIFDRRILPWVYWNLILTGRA